MDAEGGGPVSEYRDSRIECDNTGVRIHAYYFPWGTKRIAYPSIRSMERFSLTTFGGKGRIWGTGDFRHWANLDPGRPHKEVGFRLDLGKRIVPMVTPDRPDEFEAVVKEHSHIGRQAG
jgi:hypothetical protein